MSATAPSTPTVVRDSQSTSSHRDYNDASIEQPHRSHSSASRQPQIAPLPLRSNSVQQSVQRPPSSSRHAHLANVARRDYEQQNLARPSSSSRRSSSVDRRTPEQPSTNRVSSRSGHSRLASDASTAQPIPVNGDSLDNSHTPTGGQQVPRRRTTVTAQTGNWALGKTIGAGSMGKVKLARNVETAEQVAIKIVPRHSLDDHRSLQDRERADHSKEVRTAREAAIVTLVNHPFICGMRDVVRTNYHWYMLFEYVNGGQMLDYIISHGRLKEKQARKFGRQISSALDYCHRNSIVHRDLKIENILISKTGDIKIIDFGLSNLFAPNSQLKTFCGSLYFAAPELLQAKQYLGPEVDIWSFGIVLYVLVCGKVPFDDQSMPQLHAKIKKGVVEYPPWLTTECRHIISRMLVTDPRNRASLFEIMNHPWMTKGFGGAPENHLPAREPVQLPLDPKVIDKMTGFDFGSAEYITTQLERILQSEPYDRAVQLSNRKNPGQGSDTERKRSSVFDFYQRRKSANSKDALLNPSQETIQFGEDPVNAFHPLISIYYLVREKQEREKLESNPGGLSMPITPGEKPLQIPDLPAPEPAYTNSTAYEIAGEATTGGRSRPRARTHGEDEMTQKTPKPQTRDNTPAPQIGQSPSARLSQPKRESAAVGLLRRFSTRRGREGEIDKSKPQTPTLAVSGAEEAVESASPRRSMTVRKTRDRDAPPSAYNNVASNHPDLLAPPAPDEGPVRRLKGLGRSTSVNSADFRRRWSRRGANEDTSGPSGDSERTSMLEPKSRLGTAVSEEQPAPTKASSGNSRALSLGNSRRNSLQTNRARRSATREQDVPEETDQELAEEFTSVSRAGSSQEALKPVYLKGLFSVSTTSNKPLSMIRADIIRVLKQLKVEYREMRGGFSCRHLPSIDLNQVVDPQSPESRPPIPPHKRKISFATMRNNEKEREGFSEIRQSASTPRGQSRRAPDTSYTTEEESEDENATQRGDHKPSGPGETTTHVQSDLGQSMILKFEILVVKVPFLSLHGLQFKKVDGGTWQYKTMADAILKELKL